MRVALVHDYLTQRGGAERVVLALHELFPEAPVYTSVYDAKGTFAEFRDLDVRPSELQRLPHRGGRARALLPLYPRAFDRMQLAGYDLVVSSSSGWAHGVRAPGALHLCYCHNPARWLYQTDSYLSDGGPIASWAEPGVRLLLNRLRRWDQEAARRPDRYVANSRVVARRVQTLYGRESTVIHPPVDVDRFAGATFDAGAEPYDLVVSRLLPYKRVDLAIRACAARRHRLVVVGTGPAEASLRALADAVGARVDFRASVRDHELVALLGGCTALIQAGEEDFGIVPLEANAAGRPTVAFARGGARETVLDDVTGVLFHEPTEDSLVDALERVEAKTWDAVALRGHARTFGVDRFHARVRAAIDTAMRERLDDTLSRRVLTPMRTTAVAWRERITVEQR
jgi:glycosyltransferase involved in cell wall biosynthesis